MQHLLKTITILEFVVKILIGISLLFIITGVFIHLFDLYIFRNNFFIGIPLLLISLICYLFLRLFRNLVLKQSIIKLLIWIVVLALFTIGLYLLFNAIMQAISR